MGLINWLKQKIFHKKDEDKKEGKPVEPVVEENLKSEEAKDKTSGESVVEKTLEGNKVDEEPIYEVKKEEIKEESLQPEVVKEEQSVEQSIEDKVETKEEPVVEENTLEEPVQPEVKEEQHAEENKAEEKENEEDEDEVIEEKEEQSIEYKVETKEGPEVEENTLEEPVQPEVKEEQHAEENKAEEKENEEDEDEVIEEKEEQSIEDKVETKEEPVVEENTLEEPVQSEVKEEQKIEEQPVEENKVEDNSSIKDEEKYEPSKENEQSSFEEPVIQNNTDGIENNNEVEYSNPLLDLVLEDKLEKKESKVEVNDEQPIEDKAETKEEPIVEKELSDEPVQPEIKEEQHAEENKAEEKENEEDEDEVIEEKEEQTKEAEQVNSTDEPVIEKKNDEATTEKVEVDHETKEQTKEAEQVNSTDEPVIEKKNDEATNKKVEVDHETKIYNLGLAKSREGFGARLNSIANKYKEANSEYFDELERCLIEADVGVNLTMSVLDETEKMAASQHLDNPKEINDLLVDNLFMNYAKSGDSFQTEIKFDPENPTVLLMVGVNGTGKTTTIAKLAKHYKELGKKVLLVAADTFRAGAVQQLSIWANRIGVDIFERGQGADPASVCFDAVKKAINDKYDLVMVDTAGRLHTKDYLMAELGKVNRVIKKVLPVAPQEIWLALDANTGQNGVQQAKVFKEVTPLTGVVITKMDGTSKGGIILAIRDQLGVPVRFIGLGEHEDDLREFDLDRYLYALLVGEDENFEE